MENVSKILIAVFVLLSFMAKGHEVEKTEVVVISALHGAHKNHPSFDYDTLFSLVDSYAPDFVGVEIRPEDITARVSYLRSNYPFEMVELSQRHKDKVFGVDWLGQAIEGKPIPEGHWKEEKTIQLARSLNTDKGMLSKKPDEIGKLEEQQKLIVETATPASIANGDYGQLCREIDKLEETWFKNTPYMDVFRLYEKRDAEIGKNINEFVERNKGTRIVIVVGADHRTFAVENINKYFGSDVIILPVTNLVPNAG